MGGLVPDWKQAYKWFSVQIMVFAGCSMEIYEMFSGAQEFVQETIGKSAFHHAMFSLLMLGALGRLIRQEKKDEHPDAD